MGTNTLGRNITLPIYNADGTSFHGLELNKFTFDTVVMSLGDKITGDVYYPTNQLVVQQTEYVEYDGVKYYLINPPTIVKEGMASDNGQAKGMTKYSFTFYHPMFMLNNFPFTDVAVTSSESKYKSQDKTFYWIGNLVDYVAKLNKNLVGTEWVVEIGNNVPSKDKNKLSDVLPFDKQTIADALKTGYDTWEIPYIIDKIASTDARYAQGKRFLIRYGLPVQEILVEGYPFTFNMGQGVGLKNDSRTPKNNKIITRLSGFGSENNVPFGYPQIVWTGNQSWNYTINNSASAPNSYPIYDGIVGGQKVRLIHHPFTRSHLMPTIYADTVNKKVNPLASGYDPDIEIKDYYDAISDETWTYPNEIIANAPSYEIHEFSDIKPELGEKYIVGAAAFDGDASKKYLTIQEGISQLQEYASETNIDVEKRILKSLQNTVASGTSDSGHVDDVRYTFTYTAVSDAYFTKIVFQSTNLNFELEVHRQTAFPSAPWDDSMDDDGNYNQSYFRVTLPQLDFDLYACAAVTQSMSINMRSGACIGCSFPVQVDWEDYKKNFYDSDGNFAPNGSQRNLTKYPKSNLGEITVICKKEIETFGTLMPNIYQQPQANDKFVILGISLPQSYVTNAQTRLDEDMHQYMLDNNVHYFDYPLKFDEYFLATHTDILEQMKPNIVVRFHFANEYHALYIKQLSVKYGEKPLPQYNITLTDDVEIVLSQIGKVTDEVSSLRILMGGGSGDGVGNLSELFLSKQNDDTAAGMIRLLRGLQVGENFITGLLGEGGVFRVEEDGTTYLETDKLYVRMRAYFDTVEVKKYLHSGGNRIASKAGINCSRVEWLDSNGNITNDIDETVKFRCYFRSIGEDGHEITNDFVVHDLAFCKETNVVTESQIDQHGYWRDIVAVSSSPTQDGEHWIDLSKSDCLSGSDIPIAQDDIIQLGNKTDTTRQGAIIEFVGGADAPAYQIYQGINSYSLTGKNYVRFGYDSQSGGAQAYIGNPDGSTYLWYHYVTEGGVTFPRLDIKANVQFTSPSGTQTDLETFAGAVASGMADLQSQIDGEIDTWFYEGTPTLNNAPASSWTTNTEKERHLGDLYYDIGTGQTAGFAYRFIKDENNVYQWQYIEDTAITEALAAAARAQDTADSKRRVFVAQPTDAQAYDVGDLWVNATYNSGGVSYNNDVLRCMTAKAAGASFSISHWMLASKYTDDTKFNNYINAILNGSGATGDSATAAAAQKAIIDAVGGATVVDGGLLLTSLIAMRKYNGSGDRTDVRNYTTYAGISGEYDSTVYGGGLAAWYGGAMVDKYNPTTQQYDVQNGAKIGFRFDGSGYVAGGAIAWDSTGLTVANISSLVASSSIKIGVGANLSDVLTQATADLRYVTIDYFNSIFAVYRGNDRVLPNANTGNIDAIKALVGLYTDQYLSALGQNSGGGSGSGIDMSTVWAALAAPTASSAAQQIDASHLIQAGFATQSWVLQQGYITSDDVPLLDTKNTAGSTQLGSAKLFLVGASTQTTYGITYSNSNCYIGTDGCLYSGGAKVLTSEQYTGTLTGVIVNGASSPCPVNAGVVTIPAVPTNVSAFTNDAGYIASSSLSEPHLVLASPSGSGGLATFRALVASDIPDLSSIYATSDTWRTVQCNGVSIGNNTLNLVAGTNVAISASNGTLTFSSTDTNTLNTAGAVQLGSTKLYLVGASSQTDGVQTYSNVNCYIGTDGCLYSAGSKVMTAASGYLPLTGGTLTGSLTVSGNFAFGSSSIKIVNSNTGVYAPAFECYFPNCTTSYWNGGLVVGKSGSDNNAYTINFGYRGSGSTSNFIGIGFWGNDNILTIKADRTATFLSSVTASSFVKSGGTSSQFLKADGSVDTTVYLPKTGGTLTGSNNFFSLQSTTSNSYVYYNILVNGSPANAASCGYYYGLAFIANERGGYARIGVADDGTPQYWPNALGNTKYTLYHSGNVNTIGVVTGIILPGESTPHFPSSGIVSLPALPTAGGTLSGSLHINSTAGAVGWNEGIRMHIASNGWCGVVMCGSDNTGTGGTSARTWSMHNHDGSLYIVNNGSDTFTYGLSWISGAVYFKATTFSINSLTISQNDSTNYVTFNSSNHNVTIDIGSATAIYGKKFQATSDIRKKDIIDNIDLNVGVIAQAPIFDFVWKAYPDTRPSIGTSAQYWEKVLPYSVSKDQDGYLAMDYGATALAAAVLTARKVSEHERRIAALELENQLLRERIQTLEAA